MLDDHGRSVGRRRFARWRALSLTLVWALAIAHIVHWNVTGASVGRFVLSDAMKTLELGEINPGFLLLAAAALVTLVAGRFLCGWACHMGGLQDLCAWALRRVGIRPHLFRSRLLGLLPFVLAFYMFLWPTLKREAVVPLARRAWPGLAAWIGPVQPFPGFSWRLTTTSLWDGLPAPIVAVPFLIICGVATVYFLGARGLCRYGCPYAGVFNALEPLAPARVVVDPSRCDQCGLCTAACSTGVRVMEQTSRSGFVADPDCIRSLDCIAACPSGALSLGVRGPAQSVGARIENRGHRRWDLSLGMEAVLGVVAAAAFFITRGLYNAVPMLMAASLAVLAAWLTWKAICLARDANVRLAGRQLRLRGRLTLSGRLFVGVCVVLVALLAHSLAVRLVLVRAATIDDRVTVSFEQALAGRAPPGARRDAEEALGLYVLARGFRHAGFALADTPDTLVRIAWLQLVLARPDDAVAHLREVVGARGGIDQPAAELARLLLALGRGDEAVSALESAWERDGSLVVARDLMCSLWAQSGRGERGEALYRGLLARRPSDAPTRAALGRFLLSIGRPVDAAQELGRAAAISPADAWTARSLAAARYSLGDVDGALAALQIAIDRAPVERAHLLAFGAELLESVGDRARASEWRRRAARAAGEPEPQDAPEGKPP